MITHVIFDVGNVLVRWNPQLIIERSFSDVSDPMALAQQVFGDQIWFDLNKGKLSWTQAQQAYGEKFGWHGEQIKVLFHHITDSQRLLPGSVDLMKRLKAAGYSLYGLTDNVDEIVHYLRLRDDFWILFDGVVTSFQEGVLKPAPAIYQALHRHYGVVLEQSVLIDDMAINIAGAEALGMQGIQFEHSGQCETALWQLGLRF